jgi:hypothetical protein
MTSHRLLTEDRRRRAEGLLAAYGAKRERWPAALGDLYDSLRDDDALANEIDGESRLDAALAEAAPIRASAALRGGILADFAREAARPPLFSLRMNRLLPAGGFAALSVLGFVVGAANANEADDSPPDFAEAALAEAYQEETDWSVY